MGKAFEKDDGRKEEAAARAAASLRKSLSENNDELSPDLFAQAVDLLFPDFKCLRCGNDQFDVGPIFGRQHCTPEWKFDPGSRVDIICSHCGMIESHAPNVLMDTVLKLSAQDGERET